MILDDPEAQWAGREGNGPDEGGNELDERAMSLSLVGVRTNTVNLPLAVNKGD